MEEKLGVAVDGEAAVVPLDSGEKRLNELGYKQTLQRDLNTFRMFAITISTMTLFTGIVPYYSQALYNGGAVGVIWGWWIAVFFVSFIGLALSEICSSFPTTGSLYYWAASLAGPKYGPFASWMTGWLEFIGLAIGVGSQAFAGVQVLQYLILLSTGGANGGGYFLNKYQFLGFICATVVVVVALNSMAVRIVSFLDVISVWWQVIGGVILVVMLPLVAPKTQPASYVFGNWDSHLSSTGLGNNGYAFVIALLMSQYSLYGFDSAAHMTEETKGADRTGPIAIMSSIAFFSVFGWGLLLSLTFSIRDPARLFDATTATGGGYPVAQILWDAFHDRYGNGVGALVFLFMIYGSFFFGCLSNCMSAARVAYALSRDRGLPFSSLWVRLSRDKVPVLAVWLVGGIAVAVTLPVLKSNVVFFAVTSMSTVGWVGGYAVPIFFRLRNAESKFHPGPFYLGDYVGPLTKVVHAVAFCWILYTCVVFLIPTTYPITWNNFNYAPVGMAAISSFFLLWWLLDARKWFRGPVRELAVGGGEGSSSQRSPGEEDALTGRDAAIP